MDGGTTVPLWHRIENALVAYVRYIGKTLWPENLAVFYPFPLSVPLWQVIGSLFVLFILTAAAVRMRRRHPFLVVGWFWFLVTLLPVIGVIRVGEQSMADRYTYIPAIGLFIMAAWGVPELTKSMRYRKAILAVLAGAIISASAAITWQQLGYWQDSISLFRHTLHVTSGNALIHYNLGAALVRRGELDAAIREYREGLRIKPHDAEAHNNLGAALADRGYTDAAIREYREALRINPDDDMAHTNLGIALARKGHMDAAIQEYQAALRLSPDSTDVLNNLGIALASKGNLDMAIQKFQESLRLDPNNVKAHTNLGLALRMKMKTR
jgi:Flp pilus assembly protein TadD